ncbi:penicillin-binding protein activator LpoB [Phenylobacterium aquaticum]|uniref:penicillin-binding protein activator LpoB n=1 Tax=Phenylobacterium aquaticum TaxID=1763816 RepID=UPI001F5C5987|nr:penicillin-binding protein activator LpoB [Phenylobacterium aquaticum]MCI3131786.1 penicillin-binding protein activator LpoB [Phenylobacterium aquaticum]
MSSKSISAAFAALLALSAVGPALAAPKLKPQGSATVYRDTTSPDGVKGVGTESQDIVSMSDAMVRDLLTVPELMNRPTPPRIIVDPKFFRNESSEIIDKALITDRIRVNLIRSAQGRMRFIGREYAAAVEEERDLKDSGKVDVGTTGRTKAQAGADYRLVGRIGTRDAVDTKTGVTSRFSQYTFELLDMEYGEIIWSNLYEFKKENRDDVVYR